MMSSTVIGLGFAAVQSADSASASLDMGTDGGIKGLVSYQTLAIVVVACCQLSLSPRQTDLRPCQGLHRALAVVRAQLSYPSEYPLGA